MILSLYYLKNKKQKTKCMELMKNPNPRNVFQGTSLTCPLIHYNYNSCRLCSFFLSCNSCLLWLLSLASVPVRRWCSDWNRRDPRSPTAWRSEWCLIYSQPAEPFQPPSSSPSPRLSFFRLRSTHSPSSTHSSSFSCNAFLVRIWKNKETLQHAAPTTWTKHKSLGFLLSSSVSLYFCCLPVLAD
jgi:hypothetical protein